jgi:thioredoxin reductase
MSKPLDSEGEPDVLIVGAGPAGLAAAATLSAQGVENILVIDRDDAPGGLPRFCPHPGFGLEYCRWPHTGPGFAARLLKDLHGRPVRIECATTLISLREGPRAEIVGPCSGLRLLCPRAVVLATGIRESNRGNLLIPGGRAELGIMTTGQLQQLAARKGRIPDHMRSLVVVGTEHVAFSAMLTARQLGLSVRALVGEEDRVMSYAPLAWLARVRGTEVAVGARIHSIKAAGGRVRAIRIADAHGEREIGCDAILFSGKWLPEIAFLYGSPVEIDQRTNGPVIDQAMRTTCRGVFAAGNVLHGVESSGWCAVEGARAGAAVARYLRGEIEGAQGQVEFIQSPEIDFIVPQRWDDRLRHLDAKICIPVTLRVAKDLFKRRLVLLTDQLEIPLSNKRAFMRRRRAAVDFSCIGGLRGQRRALISFA